MGRRHFNPGGERCGQGHAAVDRRPPRRQPDDRVERLLPPGPALRRTAEPDPRRGGTNSATSGPTRPPVRWPPAPPAPIGVLWATEFRHSLADEVSARFLGAVADELAPSGLALTLLPATVEGPVVPARDVAMDGAIAFSCDPELPALDWLQRRGLPLVYVDMAAPRGGVAITIDDRGGARAAARHVVALGHRRVALFTSGFGDEPGPTTGQLLPEAATHPGDRRAPRRLARGTGRGWHRAAVGESAEHLRRRQGGRPRHAGPSRSPDSGAVPHRCAGLFRDGRRSRRRAGGAR